MQELKPCPFCGFTKPSIIIDEHAPIPYLGYGGGIDENVVCPQCLAHVDKKIWNTRHSAPESQQECHHEWVFGLHVATCKKCKTIMRSGYKEFSGYLKKDESLKFEEDLSVHGIAIEKDGKRIDPKDFYKQEENVSEK